MFRRQHGIPSTMLPHGSVVKFDRDLQRVKRLTILVPFLFLVLLEAVRRVSGWDFDTSWPGYLLLAAVVALGVLAFAEMVFGVIGRLEDQLVQQNAELHALNASGLDILGELNLDLVLQRVVDESSRIVGSRYGALSIVNAEGEIDRFFTSGVPPDERARIGHLPRGRGLLGIPLRLGERLIVDDIATDPRSAGFPADHPPMHSLLAVPVETGNGIIGNLYLSERQDGRGFTTANAETLGRIATQAAIAIENARLHQAIHGEAIAEERERIAHEMHDTIAQVLGYVNTKAQAVETFLGAGDTVRATEHLHQLSGAAREAYADVRENLMGLRAATGEGRDFHGTLHDYVQRWQDMSGVAVEMAGIVGADAERLDPVVELQLLRIIQEALTNVRKHARATKVWLSLVLHDGELEAVVADNGQGISSTINGGGLPRFGIATMRERAEAVGGHLSVEQRPGGGTVVRAQVPAGHTRGPEATTQ